ncbi:MAG TPA: RHS repeat-associated core domain-containing protein [Candidatus Polarisedimenticolaceae bacterium]|nr:RHS repeat-associated core domain-containing protein [Candidatus Polarisedimenticolaceae bacterium]
MLEFGTIAYLRAIRDRFGNTIRITRATIDAHIDRITSPNGRWVEFTHDAAERITLVRDNIGRTVSYGYDSYGRLVAVTKSAEAGMGADDRVTRYEYVTSIDPLERTRMVKVWRPQQVFECPPPCTAQPAFLTNEYYTTGIASGKVRQQTLADGSTYAFAYTFDGGAQPKIVQTDVTNPRTYVRRVSFNVNGYVTSDTKAFGTPQAQRTDYERQAGTNLATKITDAFVLPSGNRREAKIEYNAFGLPVRVTRLFGTATPIVTAYDYEPLYQQVTAVRGPLDGRETTFEYTPEPAVRLQSVTDGTNRRVNLTLDPAGRIATIDEPVLVGDPNAVQRRTVVTYERGDLVGVTDPSGNTIRSSVDGVGRTRSVTDPLGHTTRYSHDTFDQIRTVTDPRGGVTTFTYDHNGNLASVEDARQHETNHGTTRYFYDALDRLTRRRDQLGADETVLYDPNGNVAHILDRGHQVTDFTYDPLDRPTSVSFGPEAGPYDSFIFYSSYDGANRMTRASDSAAGAPLSHRYDGTNNLRCESTSTACLCGATIPAACEATDPGVVTYAYDEADRRTTMTVGGQSSVSYQYDLADRLTDVSTPVPPATTAQVTITPDTAGRRGVVTLPNGVTMTYGYDLSSRLSSIHYKKPDGSVLGGLTYTRDAVGNVRVVGGQWPRTGLPAAVSTASYDDANRLVQWGATTLTHDANGNVDTVTGGWDYTWNARQLVGLTGPSVDASFAYDALGRRRLRTVNGTVTTYQADGLNLAKTVTGGAITRLLEGLGLDEHFARITASGTTSFLTDQLGSTIALMDGAQPPAVTAQYTYEPFGQATVSGAGATELQFTGRENDGTGLYYYRARYHSPTWGRFISEDELEEFTGNAYQYADSNPSNLSDPLGFSPIGWIVRRGVSRLWAVKPLFCARAVRAARRAGKDVVIAATEQQATALERGARGGARKVVRHPGHGLPDGSVGLPHIKTPGKSGHLFYYISLITFDLLDPFDASALSCGPGEECAE